VGGTFRAFRISFWLRRRSTEVARPARGVGRKNLERYGIPY